MKKRLLIFSSLLLIFSTLFLSCNTPEKTKEVTKVKTATHKGTLEVIKNFYSPELDNNKTLRIYLPYNYDVDTSKRYSVIYMNDGQNLFDVNTASYKKEWKVDETLDYYMKIEK